MSGKRTLTVHPTDVVERAMVWPVATLDAYGTLREAAESLAADGIGALVVLDHGRLAGVLSERDVVNHLAQGGNPDHLTVGEVMTTDLITAQVDETILEVAQRMVDAEIRHLPVTRHDEIAGVVSIRDLFEILLRAARLQSGVLG
jgi:CBS domain-containing protein